MDELVYVPSPRDEGYVELTKTASGALYRKMILPINVPFVHPKDPNTKITVTPGVAQSLVNNFNKGICDTVQVPIVNDENRHVEDPLRNAGEVLDLDYDDKGVYATIDARKYSDDFGKTILGASAFMHLNYTDTKTGQKVGPTLLHVAATNRPYITGMSGFEEILASADIQDEKPVFLVAENEDTEVSLSHENEDGLMTLEELKAALKEHGYDLDVLVADAAKAAELSGQLENVQEELNLSAESAISVNELAEAVVELSNTSKAQATEIDALKAKNDTLELSAAENEVDALVRAGRVLPAQRDVMVKLSRSDRETFDALLPEKAIVSLSENGVTVHEENLDENDRQAAVTRYHEMAERLQNNTRRK